MSAESQELLKETVYQLLSHGQCVDSVWQEVSSLERLGGKDLQRGITELCCVPALNQASVLSGGASDVYSTRQCVDRILAMASVNGGRTWSEKEKEETTSTLSMIKQILSSQSISSRQFCTQLCREGALPVDLIWILNKHGLISLDNYLHVHASTKNFMTSFVDKLKDFASSHSSVQCMADIIAELVFLSTQEKMSGSDGIDTKKMAGCLVDWLILGAVESILDKTRKEACSNIIEAYSNISVDIDSLKKLSVHLINQILCHKPVMEAAAAVQDQSQWTYGKLCPSLVQLYKQLLLPLEASEVLDILRHSLQQQQEVNWRLLLPMVSVTVVCMPESSNLFLDLTDSLLQNSLEGCEMGAAITGLLVARQLCLQGPHVFMTYADWFQRTFGDASKSVASSRKSFVFLMKLLSDLMPYETAQHIRVHITRPPHVPAKCRQLLTDYISLAKTRMEDLKEDLDVGGQEKSAGPSDKSDELEGEVIHAVSLFEASGKVPTSVLEASIFRKPYFIGKFLPALLKPRHLPDKPDDRMKLIAALLKADKIPQSMHSSYLRACRKEAMQLLEGVFVDSDSDMEMELSPLELFETSLRHCGSTVVAAFGEQSRPRMTVEESISGICEAMETLLGCKRQGRGTGDSVDLSITYIPANLLQVVDRLLNFVAQTLQKVYQSVNPSFSWLRKMLEAVSQYAAVSEALVRRVWSLVSRQASSLSNHHVDALAAILTEFHAQRAKFPHVNAPSGCRKCAALRDMLQEASVATCVMRSLQSRTKEQMQFGLRLTSSYLKYALCQNDTNLEDLSFPEVVKQFFYLATRLMPELRSSPSPGQDCSDNIASALYKTESVQKLLQSHQISLNEWVCQEMMIGPALDLLSDFERYEYHHWAVYQWFLPRSQEDGGYGGDCVELASAILRTLLNHGTRNPDRIDVCADCVEQRSTQKHAGYSRCHVINILQGITRLLPTSKQCGLPWLQNQLREILQMAEGPIEKEKLVQDFFHICLSLPAHLLICNTPYCVKAGDEEISNVADLINSTMLNCLCEGIYFPASITLYIVQALMQASDKDGCPVVFDHTMKMCPVFKLSLAVNYLTVMPILQPVIEKSGSGTEKLLTSCSEDSDMAQTVGDIKNQEVKNNLADLLLLQLTFLKEFSGSKNHLRISRIQRALTWILPDTLTLTHLLQGHMDAVTEKCCKEGLVKARYLTILRFLKEFEGEINLEDHLILAGVSGMLQGYVDMGNLLEQNLAEGKAGSKTDADELSEWTSLTQCVIELLNGVPVSLLHQIDQELVLSCGPGITNAVISRLV